MENKALARSFRLLSQLMDLHDENPFKIKSIASAAFTIDKLPFPLAQKQADEIVLISGIGKSTGAKIIELLSTGTLQELEEYISKTPVGIVEMLGIKGIGPKKIKTIWQDLQIETLGELYYACNENRLIEAKGFGVKTQEEIKRIIEFKMAADGKFLYAKAEPIILGYFNQIAQSLNSFDQHALLGIAGDFRRCCEIIENAIFVIGTDHSENIGQNLAQIINADYLTNDNQNYSFQSPEGLLIHISIVSQSNFYLQYFKQTGCNSHVEQVLARCSKTQFKNEEEIYADAGLAFMVPELREGLNEIALAEQNKLPILITENDLKGSLHNHSTWSDGVHSLAEMAKFCRDELKLTYLGICDHSKSAFYANGLSEERVLAQHQEIDALNVELAPFRIFKGIESDILYDGRLDYEDDVLKSFDFVVASVHSQLKMDQEKATNRLITAIENPYTTILGHPTGRLLLSRKGYEIDYKKVIDACAANGVAIEINANPLRLDLDWRWHRYALDKGVLLAINPDAHRKEGFLDMRYGTLVARKGGLTANSCLNAFSLEQITNYFTAKKG